jgi:hypothetical protein
MTGKFFKHTDEAKMKMRKPKRDTSKMGKYDRNENVIAKLKANRAGKGCGIKNGMSLKENRQKVGATKIGRKLMYNPITQEKKFLFPDNIPDGWQLVAKG